MFQNTVRTLEQHQLGDVIVFFLILSTSST